MAAAVGAGDLLKEYRLKELMGILEKGHKIEAFNEDLFLKNSGLLIKYNISSQYNRRNSIIIMKNIFKGEINFEKTDKPGVTKVSVAFAGNGNLQKTTSITNMYNIDMLSSDVVGLVGVPIAINTSSKFDKATITFSYDETALIDTKEEDLCIMWYDEENNWYQILDEESVVDPINNTVVVETTHFSTYLLVDRKEWYKVWSSDLDYRTPPNSPRPPAYYDIALVLDSSGSMRGTPITNAKHAARNFVDAMFSKDRIGVIKFNSSASTIVNLTDAPDKVKKEEIKDTINKSISAGGGTATNTGLNKGIDMLADKNTSNKKAIVLLCDGDVQDPSGAISRAKEQDIKIYTVNFSSSGTEYLTKMAKDTDGKYYYAKTAEQLTKAFYEIERETYATIDNTDTDGDKLPDVFELIGMQLVNGTIVTSDPTTAHSDLDGLTDYEETGTYTIDKKVYVGNGNYGYKLHFNGKSDPKKDDSDGDGIDDKWKKDSGDPIIGTDYDFVPGLKGELITNIIYHVPEKDYIDRAGQKYLNINIDSSFIGDDAMFFGLIEEEHRSYMTGGWSLNNAGRIKIFTKTNYYPSGTPEYVYQAVMAHEFGHTLGIDDAYPEANGGKVLVNNAEISDGIYGKSGSMMFRCGLVYSNDIEMVLEAFATNKWQYPIDKIFHKKSRVVRLPQLFK